MTTTQVTINNLPAPPSGSTSLIAGDKIPATRNGITYGLTFPNTVSFNVRDFGAIGNGIHDDTAAFVAAQAAWKASIRNNLAPNSDGNKIGTIGILLPAGTYLITSPEALLDHNKVTRVTGMSFYGMAGGGQVQILYQPTVAGPLLYNNDEVLWLQFTNIWFNCNSTTADFLYSNSSGGAARVEFTDCQINGTWQNFVHLVGSNTNSEFTWNFCIITGTYTNFLWAETSDQFLNYWFNQCSISVFIGTFANMTKGGHLKLDQCDFSGFAGLSSPTLLFNLVGASSQGVCSFVAHGCRFEVGPFTTIMNCSWPFGIVSFIDSDFSSQAFQSWGSSVVTHNFTIGNNSGPIIKFDGCNLLGIHSYTAGNGSSWNLKKSITYHNCDTQSSAFADFYSMFTTGLDTGGNFGGLPDIKIENCRGYQSNIALAYPTQWSSSHVYAAGATVRAGIWIYITALGGTSGATQPTGAGTVSDGNITDWVSQTVYWPIHYVNDGGINGNRVISAAAKERMGIFNSLDGKWPVRISSTVRAATRIIPPPNSWVIEARMYAPTSASTQGSSGTFKIMVDSSGGQVLLKAQSSGALSSGVSAKWNGVYYTSAARTPFIFICSTNVTNAPDGNLGALAYLKYISGE